MPASSVIINLPGYPVNNLQSVETIDDLRALDSDGLVSGQDIAVDGDTAVGDGGGGLFTWSVSSTQDDDGKTIIRPDDTTPLAAGRWILTASATFPTAIDASSVKYQSAGDGSVERTLAQVIGEQSLSIMDFGAKIDSETDDTLAWQRAIAAAAQTSTRRILFPWGETGISLVESQIVSGGMAMGLSFVGVGQDKNDPYNVGPQLRYTGTDPCWDIKFPTGGPASTGNWSWENIGFFATDPAATMFSFNDPLTHTPSDIGGYMFIQKVAFRNCYGIGPSGGTSQLGDFIRACKTFYIFMDNQTTVRAWRRGIWLKGCDNCRIDANFYGNIRHIHAERPSGTTFGNQLVVGAALLGEVFEGVEDSYPVYDDGCYGTVIEAGVLFEATGIASGGHCKAHIYLNGLGTLVEKPVMSFAPLFHLGPNAREVTMTEPVITVFNSNWAPIIDTPANWDFGSGQTNLTMRLEGASQLVQDTVGVHPRIRYPTAVDATTPSLDKSAPSIPLANGYQRPVVCSGLNYWGNSAGSVGGQPIKGLLADSNASGGYAIVLDRTVAGSGFFLRLVVGRDIVRGHHLLSMRSKNASGWAVGYRKNTDAGTSFSATSGATFAQASAVIDTTSWSAGDNLEIYVYHPGGGSLSADMSIDYVSLTPVSDGGWTAATGTASKGSYATYTAQTYGGTYNSDKSQADSDAIQAASERIKALEDALRAAGIIG